jgi:hypothetical protein
VVKLLYEDNKGNILHPDKLDEYSAWEVEEMGIHVFDERNLWV